jgi:hypothetical protein
MREYYGRECNNPVQLTLEISLQGLRMGLKAYVCGSLGVPGGKTGCMFTKINVDVIFNEPEVIILLAILRCCPINNQFFISFRLLPYNYRNENLVSAVPINQVRCD